MSAANGHVAVTVCAGCHLTECPGDCDWNDTGTKDTVCRGCCWDHTDNARSQHCLDHHDHGGSHCPCVDPKDAALIAEMRAGATLLDRLNTLYGHGDRCSWSPQDLRNEAQYLEENP